MRKRITIEVSGEKADEVILAVAEIAKKTAYHNQMNDSLKIYQKILPEKSLRKDERRRGDGRTVN